MKLLFTLLSFFSMGIALAQTGQIESYFGPSLDEHHPGKVVHLYLQNNCYQDVLIATRSESSNGVWETKGYMRLFPGQVIYHSDILNNLYYLSAMTLDGRIRWEGEHQFELHSRPVRALLVELPRDYSGNWTTVLYCY